MTLRDTHLIATYPLDAEVLECEVKGGVAVKTGVGYYPHKGSYVMVKVRKL